MGFGSLLSLLSLPQASYLQLLTASNYTAWLCARSGCMPLAARQRAVFIIIIIIKIIIRFIRLEGKTHSE